MRRDKLNRLFNTAYEQAAQRRRALNDTEREISALRPPEMSQASTALEEAFMRITTGVEHFKTCMEGYEAQRSQSAEYYRTFQDEHGVRRPAIKPDLFMAIYVIVGFSLLEGTAAGFLLIGEGHMDIIVGLAFGLIFASLNVCVAVAGAFFGLRNAMWKLRAPETDAIDLQRRLWGCGGLLVSLIILVALLWVAMRVRALGSHHGIFSLSEVGIFETINDGLSIALVVLGALGAAFGFYKGYSGLSDAIPGYTKARSDVEDLIVDEVTHAAAELEADIEEIFEAAEILAEETTELRDACLEAHQALIARYASAREAHNDQITQDLLRLKSVATRLTARKSAIVRREITPADTPDYAAMEAMAVPPLAVKDASKLPASSKHNQPIEFHLSAVADAKARALADIRQALISFAANTPDLSVID